MKIPKFIIRLSQLALAGTVVITLGACASFGSLFRQSDSPLPIDAQSSLGGQIVSTRAFETQERLYVSGSMKKGFGSHIPPAADVDVRLIDASGRVIAEKQDDIDPGHPRLSSGRSGRYSYVVSFPISEARQASKIEVQYDRSHKKGHSSR